MNDRIATHLAILLTITAGLLLLSFFIIFLTCLRIFLNSFLSAFGEAFAFFFSALKAVLISSRERPLRPSGSFRGSRSPLYASLASLSSGSMLLTAMVVSIRIYKH